MTIECTCPGCGQHFRTADSAAGKQVKCPKCSTPIRLPEKSPATPTPPIGQKLTVAPPVAGAPNWFVQTPEGKQHGPMDKDRLDQLVAQRRLDAFCQVRRADWDEWKLIEEVYPAFAINDEEDELLGSGAPPELPSSSDMGRSPRVRPCPDCGQTVSRRAAQCPHCGCPLARDAPSLPPVQPPPVPQAPPRTRARRRALRRIVFLATALVLLVAVVATGIYVGLHGAGHSTDQGPTVEGVVDTRAPEQTRPQAPAPVAGALSAEQIAKCKDEVAAAMAREVDDDYRRKHKILSAVPELAEYARTLEELVPELSNQQAKRPKGKESRPRLPDPRRPYESQFESLRRECRSYLDAHVAEPVQRKERIWQVGRDWVKMRLPERKLLDIPLQSDVLTPDTR